MLFIFLGSNTETVRAAAQKEISSRAEKKKLVAERFDAYRTEPVVVEEIIFGNSLFGGTRLVVLDGLIDGGLWTPTAEHWEAMGKSGDTFIVIEEELPEDIAPHAEKHGTVTTEDKAETWEGWSKDHYAFADAVAEGRRKDAWTVYQKLLRAGHAPEELHSVLWWQAKNMQAALHGKTAADTGLKPFVYTKARRAAETKGTPGTAGLLKNLITVYHEARRGGELELLIEKFILDK